jgi:hypothetical protein
MASEHFLWDEFLIILNLFCSWNNYRGHHITLGRLWEQQGVDQRRVHIVREQHWVGKQ